jgi:hypothetical protein
MLGRAALWYARHGFAVFPLRPLSKIPLISKSAGGRGHLDGTTDIAKIERWWKRYPKANIGIACFLSGIVVIDVDPRNGGDDTLATLEREHGPLPPTWTVLTPSGGQHYYYRVPDGFDTDAATLGPGIDLKWRGYVVAPPSVVAVSDRERKYEYDAACHPADTVIADFVTQVPSKHRSEHRPSSGVDAAESFLGAAFESMKWLGDVLPDGRRMARCPWAETHSDGRGFGDDTSCVLFPRSTAAVIGGFRCSHSHCEHRTWRDVLDILPAKAHDAAKLALRRYGLGQQEMAVS